VPVLDDRDEKDAVVEEDLGDLGVGEVGADVDVLGVHPVAHGLELAAGTLLERALERARDEAGVLELAEVTREDGGDELALAEDADVDGALDRPPGARAGRCR
jgi:GNAT superfamily N-acetyltransferase